MRLLPTFLLSIPFCSGFLFAANPRSPGPEGTAEEWLSYIEIEESAEDVRQRFREKQIPTSFTELLGKRPPDSENGWMLFEKILQEFKPFLCEHNEEIRDLASSEGIIGYPEKWITEAQNFLDNEKVDQLQKLVQDCLVLPNWFPIRKWEDGFEMIIPNIGPSRQVGQILSINYKFALLTPDAGQCSFKVAEKLVRLSRKVAQEGSLISFLAGSSIRMMPPQGAREAYAAGAVLPEPPEFDRKIWASNLNLALNGERLIGEIGFQQTREGKDTFGGFPPPDGLAEQISHYIFRYVMIRSAHTDEDQYLKQMEMAVSNRNTETSLTAILRTKEFHPLSINAILLPALGTPNNRLSKLETVHTGWQLAHAIESFKKRFGHFPDSMNQLTLPADPPLKEFRYIVKDDRSKYLLFPEDSEGFKNALEKELSPLIWFPPGSEITEFSDQIDL